MSSDVQTWRSTLRTTATGVTAGSLNTTSNRCGLGYKATAPDLDTLASDGPYMNVGAGGRPERDIINLKSTWRIPVDLWIGLTRSSDQTMANPESYVCALADAWEALGHVTVTWDVPEINADKNPLILHYQFEVSVLSC